MSTAIQYTCDACGKTEIGGTCAQPSGWIQDNPIVVPHTKGATASVPTHACTVECWLTAKEREIAALRARYAKRGS